MVKALMGNAMATHLAKSPICSFVLIPCVNIFKDWLSYLTVES